MTEASLDAANQAPAQQVWPTLRARDARSLIRYLVEVFGFEETAVFGEADDVHHAQLSWPPGGGIMMGSARDDGPDGWALQPGTFGAYVVTDDIDALYERVQKAGGDVFRPLAATSYGSTEFAVRDPEGNLWSFGTYRGEPRDS